MRAKERGYGKSKREVMGGEMMLAVSRDVSNDSVEYPRQPWV